MTRRASILAAALAVAALMSGPAARALTLETRTAPDGGPQFADPDEKLRIGGAPVGAERDGRAVPRSSGFGFSFSGSSGRATPLVPGYSTPGQYGPRLDPQTGEPYPR